MAMLEINDLHVNYGMIAALKGISFEVNEGEVISLIGANGAERPPLCTPYRSYLCKIGFYQIQRRGAYKNSCPQDRGNGYSTRS